MFTDEPDKGEISLSISTQGAGLRMWICKELVELQGGAVGVEGRADADGSGSVFFVEMPMSKTTYDPLQWTDFRAVPAFTFEGFGDIGN